MSVMHLFNKMYVNVVYDIQIDNLHLINLMDEKCTFDVLVLKHV